jgi:hypothetical protein
MIFEVFISISFNGLDDDFEPVLGGAPSLWGRPPRLFIQNSEWLLCGMKFAPEI